MGEPADTDGDGGLMSAEIELKLPLVDAIQEAFERLKASDDKATRELAETLGADVFDLIGRMARTILLARDQRNDAREEQARLVALLDKIDPCIWRGALLAMQAADSRRELAG